MHSFRLVGHRRSDPHRDRIDLVRGHAFFREHGHQPASFRQQPRAAARDGVRESLPAIRRHPCRRRRADARACPGSERRAGGEALAAEEFLRLHRGAAGQRLLCAERAVVRAGRAARAADDDDVAGAAAGAGFGRRSELARRGSRAAIRAARRAVRQSQARQDGVAADACGQHARPGECQQAGELFLAGPGPGPGAKILRSDAVPENPAGARLFGAAAGHEGEQRHPPGRRRPRPCCQISGARAPDRPGADERRPIRHHQRERGAQRSPDHCRGAVHPLAGAALVANHPGGLHQSCGRTVDHCGAGHPHGRRLQPDIGLLRRAVRRPRASISDSSSASAIAPNGTKSTASTRRCCTPAGAPVRR